MISVTSAQLGAWLGMFIWPFVRILALLSTDPIFGNRAVPFRIKLGLAVLITVIVAPTLDPMPTMDPGSPAGLLILMQQIVIGISMGLAMRIAFVAVEMAGHLIGLQMGLGFATVFDPAHSAQVPVVAQFLGIFSVLVFFAINGHLMIVSALVDSFHVLPVGIPSLLPDAWKTLASWGAEIFRDGLLLSLPVVATLLITNIAIGIMTRAAPQLNIFAVGFPLTLMAGFALLYFTIPLLIPLLERVLSSGVGAAMQVLQNARPLP
jgi:flagellar biosynthesis protein FliR